MLFVHIIILYYIFNLFFVIFIKYKLLSLVYLYNFINEIIILLHYIETFALSFIIVLSEIFDSWNTTIISIIFFTLFCLAYDNLLSIFNTLSDKFQKIKFLFYNPVYLFKNFTLVKKFMNK